MRPVIRLDGQDRSSIRIPIETPALDLAPPDEVVFVLVSAPPDEHGIGGDVEKAEPLETESAARMAGARPRKDLPARTQLGAREADYQAMALRV
jgi:hypothetical protein